MRAPQVLVVGAGPVGLAMAAELARHGVAVRVIDRGVARTEHSKAIVCWSRTLETFATMGLVDDVLPRGIPAHRISIFADGRRALDVHLDELRSPYPFALLIPQSETEAALDAHLQALGVHVERRTRLERFVPARDRVTCHLLGESGSEEVLEVAWLVGCDGAHSTVRHGLNLPFVGRTDPNDWVLADVRLEGSQPRDEVQIFWSRDGVLGLFPVPDASGDRFRIVADGGASSGDAAATPTLDDVQRLLEARGPQGTVAREANWLAGFRINERRVGRYQRGHCFLAGDAAHVHSPAGGQGMNLGIQDAFNLGWKLALVIRGRAHPALLESYTRERLEIGKAVLRNAEAMTRLATLRSPLAQGLRNRVLPFVAGLEVIQQRARQTLSELGVTYRGSLLSDQHVGVAAHAWLLGKGVAAGDRAPDADLVENAAAPTRLFTLLRDTRFSLLLLSGVAPTPDSLARLDTIADEVQKSYADAIAVHRISAAGWPAATLMDPEARMHAEYGAAAETLFLVRPDGYVGYRSQPAEWKGLRDYLARILIA